ncbi:hypothetical protein CHS0354_032306 [Potamilus streckersoni]|nr:hypothetical protein CHS0354_032306 [Potamilus streckersoni]
MFIPATRPHCIIDQYSLCDPTPIKILRSADTYRKDGLSGSKLFKFWPVVTNETKIRTPDLSFFRKVQRVKSFEKKYKQLKLRERPKTICLDQFMLDDLKTEAEKNKKNDEKCLTSSEPPVTVAIDTSGTTFERLQLLRNSGTESKEEKEKKKKRRRTVSGIPNVLNEIDEFERKRKAIEKRREQPRSYSFDDLDAEPDDVERDETVVKYLDEIEGKREDRREEDLAMKEPKLMRFFTCGRSRSLPRCMKLSSVTRSMSAERKSQKDANTSYGSSLLSIASVASNASSRMSRSTKRSSIISDKLRSIVTRSSSKERKRPKSLDLDALDDFVEVDKTKSLVNVSNTQNISLTQKEKSDPSVGPGNYYYFDSNTLPRAQAKKYNFPWESLPKDWTTSVKLREISKRRSKEDRQSSSGNWSGYSSSNRQSLDSDLIRSEGIPYHSQLSVGKDSGRDSPTLEEVAGCTDGTSTAEFGGDESSTLTGDTDTISSGNHKTNFTDSETETWLQSLAIRAANRAGVDASASTTLSRLTRQNIMALDLMMSSKSPAKKDDEISSVYSLDQEGFYTSFHTDSGLRKSTGTLIDESEDFSQNKDSLSIDSFDSVIHIPDDSEKFAGIKKGKAKVLSKVTPPAPPPRSSSKISYGHQSRLIEGESDSSGEDMAKLNNPKELMSIPSQDSSQSESDQVVVSARLRSKTQISSNTAFPPMCVVTSGSDDESSDNTSQTHHNRQRLKVEGYIFDEEQCEVIDMAYKVDGKLSDTLLQLSIDQGNNSLNMSEDEIERSGKTTPTNSSSDAGNKDQGYHTMTLPKAWYMCNFNGQENPGYKSWPRSNKSSEPTITSILKTPEKNMDGPRPPKTLNFDPFVSLINPGNSSSLQVPLPSPSNSSSDENQSSFSVTGSSFINQSAGSSYRLAMPLQSPNPGLRGRQQKEKQTSTKHLPLKYQPVITVTPKERPADQQGSDFGSNGGAYVKLSQEDSSGPFVLYTTSVQSTNTGPMSVPANSAQSPNPNMYAVGSLGIKPDRNSLVVTNGNGYMDMKAKSSSSLKKSLSASSIASSECLDFADDNTYVSMSSPCSSPNLSMIDIPIVETPTGSMDSLTKPQHYDKDTHHINALLTQTPKTRSSASAGDSGYGNREISFSTFMAPDHSVASSSFSSMSSSFLSPTVYSPNVSTDQDLTIVSQMSSMSYPMSSSTPYQHHHQQQQGNSVSRTDKSPVIRGSNSSRLETTTTRQQSKVHSNQSSRGRNSQPPVRNSQRDSSGRKATNQNGERAVDTKGLILSKSVPVDLRAVFNQPTAPTNSPRNCVQNSRNGLKQSPNSSWNPVVDKGGNSTSSSARTDSYRVAMAESPRNGSHQVGMHQSKSFPQLPPSTRSGPLRVAANISGKYIPVAPLDDAINRADSYRMAVRNTNGVVENSRNTSYRVAVDEQNPITNSLRFEPLNAGNSVLPGGRDIRRMGITDIDQVKDIDSDKIIVTSASQSGITKSGMTAKKRAKPDADPIQVLSSMDYNRNDTKKSSKNPNRSSTYICFDPIFEDKEDFTNSQECLRLSSTSLKTLTPETFSDKSIDRSGNKVNAFSGSTSSHISLNTGFMNGSRSEHKSKTSKNVEIQDDWRFSAV